MAGPVDKAAQEAEAQARQNAGIDPAENAYASEGSDADGGAPAEGATARPAAPAADGDAPRAPPIARAPRDSKFTDIVGRFRQHRGEEADADAVDAAQMNEFVRSGMPPEFTESNAPVTEAAPEPQGDAPAPATDAQPPAPAPQKLRLKVHGEEKEYSLDEVIAQAQIALASGNLLETSKGKLKEIDDLLAQTRDRVQRADQPAQHQVRQDGTQSAEPAAPAQAPPNQEDPLGKLIETLQFGDPGEARNLLENTIQQRVDTGINKAVPAALRAERFKDEGARSQKVLAAFLEENADLANDPMANAAIERNVYDLQVEDLKAIGVDPSRIPTPTGQVTPADIATAHRWYRTEGFKVRDPATMLTTARDNFLKWKGVAPAATNQTLVDPATPKAPPRVEVRVDRDARRAAVPQQPTRTVTPRQDAPAAAAQRTDGSSIVQRMNARRALPRGKAGMQ